MIHIRPPQLFDAFPTQSTLERTVRIVLTSGRYPGTTMLETAILIILCRLVKASRVFEFGTYTGTQTLNLAMNLPPTAVVYTLDLDPESYKKIRYKKDEWERQLTEVHLAHRSQLDFVNTPYEDRIVALRGDSKQFDFSSFIEMIDLVYVDGGHDLRTLASDTENALKMLPERSPGCVVWHDYRNPAQPQVTAYLEELSDGISLYHVEESWSCFYLKNIGLGEQAGCGL